MVQKIIFSFSLLWAAKYAALHCWCFGNAVWMNTFYSVRFVSSYKVSLSGYWRVKCFWKYWHTPRNFSTRFYFLLFLNIRCQKCNWSQGFIYKSLLEWRSVKHNLSRLTYIYHSIPKLAFEKYFEVLLQTFNLFQQTLYPFFRKEYYI